jgi:Domain of unknown function (DUF5667)
MSRVDDELDRYGKRLLAPLQETPPMDAQISAQEKARFLSRAEKLRKDLTLVSKAAQTHQSRNIFDVFRRKQGIYFIKAMAITILVLGILLGSSFTVYAAQSSLPGETLYAVKSLSEDVRLSLTTSSQEKLNLILDYTNRRADEINQLAARGKSLPEQTSKRYQSELESALQLAANMNDEQMQHALGQIKQQAERQGMTLEELITGLPPQAEPAIIHLQQRLEEQVSLSNLGEKDPKGFRLEMRARQHRPSSTLKTTPVSGNTNPNPTDAPGIPQPTDKQIDNGNGSGNQKPSQAPGHGEPDSGQGNQGNGKHTPEPTP